MTPPLTPDGTQETFKSQIDYPRAIFQTYLRAFYPFHPTCDETSSTVTLPLNQGDIVLVHSVHTNGWADGTLLISGARGWLPTNYCEAYDHGPIRNLMRALTNFWDLIRGRSNEHLAAFNSQDYVRGLVAGVRFLLVCLLADVIEFYYVYRRRETYWTSLQEKTSCLNRESPNVQSNDALRRNRKALLSDLSNLVKTSKRLQSISNEDPSFRLKENDLEEMILKAFKMVTRGVKFLDIWNEDVGSEETNGRSIIAVNVVQGDTSIPPTPPAESVAFGTAEHYSCYRNSSSQAAVTGHPLSATSLDTGDDPEQTNNRSRNDRLSQSLVCPRAAQVARQVSRPPSLQVKRESLSHRISYVAPSPELYRSSLASMQLSTCHDDFLAFLGSFVSLHLETRSSTELLVITQQSVIACRNFLAVVDAVWERDLHRSELLEEARDDMYTKITQLVQAARDVFQPAPAGEDDLLHPAERKRLVDAGTACVRGAGESMAKTRFVIERIGDFEFESTGLSISTFAEVDFEASAGQPHDPLAAEQEITAISEVLVPPQPANNLPPPPHVPLRLDTNIQPISLPQAKTIESPIIPPYHPLTQSILPPLPRLTSPLLSQEDDSPHSQTSDSSCGDTPQDSDEPSRAKSIGDSSTESRSTYIGSTRDSETSVVSLTSTRATSPDMLSSQPFGISASTGSLYDSQFTVNEECEDVEAKVLEKTFAHELVYNKDGQVTGGTLPALIERLTTYDSTPDALFVSTFYLTFRLFATPTTFAQALIDRFEYVKDSPNVAGPVRLRVYNVFKGWMESHWRNDCDKPALDLVLPFAANQLSAALPTAGKRLVELAGKVSNTDGPLVPRLISSIGKTNTSIAQYVAPDVPLPPAIITKSQLSALSNWKHGGAAIGILDFDPLELARQLTIKSSRIFCSILPEELLATEWTKKSSSMAVNVRATATLATDLAHLVAECILQLEDPRKRAKMIKQWVKIANKCVELNNYDTLMAILCSLNSSTILRLKRTWELVSTKTKTTLEHLKSIVEVTRNHAVLRQRLQNHVPPCLPFVGTYLTDLTFVDVGNQATRQLPREGNEAGIAVINFDKHMKTAKIISDLQRFQIPYRLIEVPELQTWIQDQLVRVRSSESTNVQNYYRRSLLLEPREQTTAAKSSPAEIQNPTSTSNAGGREKPDIFGMVWMHPKEKSMVPTIPSLGW
ncbi:hypothetical protein MMC24_006724 [Lignoscripta atroalba]|nr:hypothetical protein [Lignoscripta atroalba]